MSYRLVLPESLAGVHDVFHVSQLRRYLADPSHVIDHSDLVVEPDLSFEELSVGILDRREKLLRNKSIPLVRVAWRHHSPGESTWEREDEMKRRFPFLFEN